MPRRKRTPSSRFRAFVVLMLSALALFAIAETYRRTRTEDGQLALARSLGLGDPARVTRLVGKRLRGALERYGVPPDSIAERLVEGRRPASVWRVGLPHQASLLQLNYAVTQRLRAQGLAVLSGREGWTDHGAPMLRLVVGLPRRATHEVQFVQSRGGAADEPIAARLALVLFGFGEDAASADSFFSVRAPFAVAVVPEASESRQTFRAAHERGREVVLHVPLEPLNYPRVNPGPGTLLVSMKPSKVSAEVRRMLDQADPVTAVANHMGSLATQDMTLMRALYRELKKNDLVFLHVGAVAGAVCQDLAAEMGVDYEEPDAVVDHETRQSDTRGLDRQWTSLLEQARARGHLIVWMRATPLTRDWLPGALSSKRLDGVSVVPLSALIGRPSPW